MLIPPAHTQATLPNRNIPPVRVGGDAESTANQRFTYSNNNDFDDQFYFESADDADVRR